VKVHNVLLKFSCKNSKQPPKSLIIKAREYFI
jgi:hypothetical protein